MLPVAPSRVVQPVILAGGSGTRLWPLSRSAYPKQFLSLSGEADGHRSLFQLAVARLARLGEAEGVGLAAPLIVGNEEHRFLMLDQLREVGAGSGGSGRGAGPAARPEPASVLLEPTGRNTAPAVTLAALRATEADRDPVLVVTPADQTVTDEAAFTAALGQAVRAAEAGAIVVLGIRPERPETGYGYIRASASGLESLQSVRRVEAFVEKPDLATAKRYVADGDHYWNAGIFVLRASVWLQALEALRPDILAATRAAWDARTTDDAFVRPGKAEFAAIPSESVDYAVMEHAAARGFEVRMVALDAGWSDLGAWDAVWQVAPKDGSGNAHVGDAILHESRNSLVHATSRLVGVVGLDDVVVVETPDAVLVSRRGESQNVKAIVQRLQQSERSEHTLHRQVHRPWGWYDSIDAGPRFQVKRIMVKPGASLSLQKHHHRAEHWIVVTGTAEVTNGDKVILLTENQSTYIPLGQVHRLANPGKVPLEIIEVQSGSYLGEDDIVRFEDTYGRA